MSRNKQRLINLHTSTENKKPAGQLLLGEIAVEHSSVKEAKLYVATATEGTEEQIATFITGEKVQELIDAGTDDLRAVSAQTVANASAIASHQTAYEGLLDEVNNIKAWPASAITAAQIVAWDAAEQNAKDYADSADTELKEIIDAYTVNGYAISGSPVLNGADIKLDGYTKAITTAAIGTGDTVNVALGKLEKAIEDTGGDAISLIEAGNGITVSEKANHKQTVSAKVDSSATEAYLKNGANGLYVEGIDAMVDNDIKTAIEGLDATVGTQTVTTGKHVAVQVVEADGKLSALTVTENDIASADNLDALSGVVATFSGNVETAIEEAVDSAATYTNSKIDAEVTRANAAYAAKTYETKVDNFIGTDTSKTARQIAEEEKANAITSASSMDAALKTELIGDMTGETKTLGGLEDRIDAIDTGMAVTMATTPTTEGYLKSYIFTQGNTTIGTVDIPKDFLLKSGSVVKNPAGQPEGTYLDLVINVASGSATDQHVYINVADLCDAYTGDNSTIEVSTGNVISVKDGVFDLSGAADTVKSYVMTNYATSAQTEAADTAVLTAAKNYTDSGIAALDATVGSTTVASGKHVAVQVVEENGVITGVTVTETIDGSNIKLTGYTSGTSTADIAASDTVNEAFGKLENKVKAAVAGGLQAVEAGDGIDVTAVANNKQTITVDMSDLVDTTADAGVALVVTDNNVKVTVTEGSVAEGNTSVVLGGQVYDAIDALDADKTGTTADGFISVEVHEDAGKITAVTTTDKVVALASASSSNKGLAEASDVASALAGKADTATTLAGYGITDAYTSAQTDSAIATAIGAESARSETAYAKKATTLAGYGIADAYTKTEADAAFAAKEHTHTKSEITDFGEYLSASTQYVANAVQTDGVSACTTTFTIKQAGSEDSTVTIKHDYIIDCGSY